MMNRSTNKPPLYLRIHAHLKKRLETGEWGMGAMLPSENELCDFYSISRGTVRQVLAELEKEGLIRRERGRGTFASFTSPASGPSSDQMVSFIVPYV
jgi:GntR family transcriptional regulator